MTLTADGGVGHHLVHQCRQFDRSHPKIVSLVESGQGEQVIHEVGHSDRLGLDALERLGHVPRQLVGKPGGKLRVTANAGQRCPQLMARVLNKAPHPGFTAVTGAKGVIHVVEHAVHRIPELTDFGVRVSELLRHAEPNGHLPPVQPLRSHLLGGGAHSVEGAQRHPRAICSQATGKGNHRDGDGEDENVQPANGGADFRHRQPDNDASAIQWLNQQGAILARPTEHPNRRGLTRGELVGQDRAQLVRGDELQRTVKVDEGAGDLFTIGHGNQRADLETRSVQPPRRSDRVRPGTHDLVEANSGLLQVAVQVFEEEPAHHETTHQPDQHAGHRHQGNTAKRELASQIMGLVVDVS